MYRKTFIIIFFVIHFHNTPAQSFRSEEGPYQTVITNTSSCSAGAPWLPAAITAYSNKGQSLLRGSFNVTKEIRDMKRHRGKLIDCSSSAAYTRRDCNLDRLVPPSPGPQPDGDHKHAELRRRASTAYSKGQPAGRHCSFNVTKEVKDMKFRLTMHYLEAKKVKVFDKKNQNCHNNVIELILSAVRVPFNRQNCKVKPGYYEYRDLNMDAIMHTVVQSLWYGAAQLRLDVDVRAAPLFCIDIFYRTVKI